MTITEYNSLSPQDQSVAQLGYSKDDLETISLTPCYALDEDGDEYIDGQDILAFDHYTNSYWILWSGFDDLERLTFGPYEAPSETSSPF